MRTHVSTLFVGHFEPVQLLEATLAKLRERNSEVKASGRAEISAAPPSTYARAILRASPPAFRVAFAEWLCGAVSTVAVSGRLASLMQIEPCNWRSPIRGGTCRRRRGAYRTEDRPGTCRAIFIALPRLRRPNRH